MGTEPEAPRPRPAFRDDGLGAWVERAGSGTPDEAREAFEHIADTLKDRLIGPEDETTLADCMTALAQSRSSRTRAHVAYLLRYMAREDAEPALKILLKDDNAPVQSTAKATRSKHSERALIGHLPIALDPRLRSRLDAVEKRYGSMARDAAIRFGLFLTEYMVSAMNHQMKNALSPVAAYLQRLGRQIENGDSRDELHRSVEIALQQLTIATRVLDQSLNYVKPSTPSYGKVSLRAIVDTALDAIRHVPPLPSAGEDFRVDVDPSIIIDAEEGPLREALVNILKNAVEASPKDKPVVLEVTAKRNRGNVVLEIADDGCGMSAADCEGGVFKPFGSHKEGGTGLGMPIAKKIIESDHRGTITLRSDFGTTVTLTLPAKQRMARG
jgi:signal transduction histidine kinase